MNTLLPGNFVAQIVSKYDALPDRASAIENAVRDAVSFCAYLCERNKDEHMLGIRAKCHQIDADSLRDLLK